MANPRQPCPRGVESLDQGAEPGAPAGGLEHDHQVGGSDDQLGIAHENPAAERPGVGEVKGWGKRSAEFAHRIPGEGGDPCGQGKRTLTEARPVGRAALGIAAGGGIEA